MATSIWLLMITPTDTKGMWQKVIMQGWSVMVQQKYTKKSMWLIILNSFWNCFRVPFYFNFWSQNLVSVLDWKRLIFFLSLTPEIRYCKGTIFFYREGAVYLLLAVIKKILATLLDRIKIFGPPTRLDHPGPKNLAPLLVKNDSSLRLIWILK